MLDRRSNPLKSASLAAERRVSRNWTANSELHFWNKISIDIIYDIAVISGLVRGSRSV